MQRKQSNRVRPCCRWIAFFVFGIMGDCTRRLMRTAVFLGAYSANDCVAAHEYRAEGWQ